MVNVACFVSLVLASRPDAAPSHASRAAPESGQPIAVWVAQETPDGRPPLPPGPSRRFLDRDGVKSVIRRRGQDPKKPGEESQEQQTASATPGAPATPPSATPPGPPRPTPAGTAGTAGTAAATAAAATAATTAPKAEGEPLDFAERAKKGNFSFDFAKAEITDVVKAISNLTRKNFIIPEKLKGQKITILSPTKISTEEAYQVFLVALEVNGISIVKAGKFYKLVESKEAIKSTIPTCIGDEDKCPRTEDQMITLILRLRHVDGGALNPVIKSLLSKEGEVTLFAPSNAVIISEYAPNLARVRRIIDALDVPGFEDELQIVQVQYAAATEIADKLTQVFDVQRGTGGAARPGAAPGKPPRARPGAEGEAAPPPAGGEGEEEAEVRISKIVPDDRTNQIIIKANRASFDAIRRLIDRLDVPTEDPGGVHVYYLENADAEELSSTLSSLAQGGSSAQHKTRPSGGAAGGGGKGAGAAPVESAELFAGEVKVTADKATNSLLIVASGRDFAAMRTIIQELDVPRRQVYVEAAILEVTVNDNRDFGVSWHAPVSFSESDLGSNLGGPGTLGFVQSAQGTGGTSPTLGALANPAALLGVAGGSLVGIIGKGRTFTVGDDTVSLPSFGVILKALQSSSNAQVLSTPHILTMDNEEATIEVGQKIPFQRGTSLPTNLGAGLGAALGGTGNTNQSSNINSMLGGLGGYGNLFSSVDRIDVSLKLTLTPQVNERDKVRLETELQIEDVVGQDKPTGQPITANRSAKTTVVIEDQQTVVLGGLMRDRTTASESKIPLLGDLPLIGWLFKERSKKTEKVNLILVLTPYIIRDTEDFEHILQQKMQQHEEFAAEYYGHRPEYRAAYVNYRRKLGPIAKLISKVRAENARLENGGKGAPGESLVAPDGDARATSVELDKALRPGEAIELPAGAAPVTDGPAHDSAPAVDAVAPGGGAPVVAPAPVETAAPEGAPPAP